MVDACIFSAGALSEASVDMFFIDTTPFIDEYWSPNQTQTFDWRGLAPRPQQLQSQLEVTIRHTYITHFT
jgi:hypothetical protein